MNLLNPLATAALVMIGIAQIWQAWTALQPTPQETHLRVVQGLCKKQAQKSGDAERVYVACMTEFTQSKKLKATVSEKHVKPLIGIFPRGVHRA